MPTANLQVRNVLTEHAASFFTKYPSHPAARQLLFKQAEVRVPEDIKTTDQARAFLETELASLGIDPATAKRRVASSGSPRPLPDRRILESREGVTLFTDGTLAFCENSNWTEWCRADVRRDVGASRHVEVHEGDFDDEDSFEDRIEYDSYDYDVDDVYDENIDIDDITDRERSEVTYGDNLHESHLYEVAMSLLVEHGFRGEE